MRPQPSTHPVSRFGAAASLRAALSAAIAAAGSITVLANTEEAPTEIELTGVVRDFKERTVASGHPDFERKPNAGFGHYSRNVSQTLGEDGKPVFVGGGARVATQWRDAAGRPICYALFDPARGDTAGSWGANDSGGVESSSSFDQWFRDVPGVNLSAPLAIRLIRDYDGSYVFDDNVDPLYDSRGGFFAVDNMLYGNSPGAPNHNYHFTYELHTEFTYDADANQVFRFTGDDDVFVFVDGKMVIDIGGVHAAVDQTVELNRLGLEDGQTYTLDFFFAERHRTQSNFRIQTNLVLSTPNMPSVTSAYD